MSKPKAYSEPSVRPSVVRLHVDIYVSHLAINVRSKLIKLDYHITSEINKEYLFFLFPVLHVLPCLRKRRQLHATDLDRRNHPIDHSLPSLRELRYILYTLINIPGAVPGFHSNQKLYPINLHITINKIEKLH